MSGVGRAVRDGLVPQRSSEQAPQHRDSGLWTVPNLFTLLRFVLIIPAVISIFYIDERPWLPLTLVAVFSLTDWVDGFLARLLNQYSVIGAGVGLGPNALRAMDMLEPKFKELYDQIATGNVTPGKNNVIFDTLLAKPGFGIDEGWGDHIGAPIYDRTSVHRKDLLDIMTSLIPIETVRFSKKATHYSKTHGEELRHRCVCRGLSPAPISKHWTPAQNYRVSQRRV